MQIVQFSFLMIFAVWDISGLFFFVVVVFYRNGHMFGKKTHAKVTNINNNNKTQ